jgi:hypothetical protein
MTHFILDKKAGDDGMTLQNFAMTVLFTDEIDVWEVVVAL